MLACVMCSMVVLTTFTSAFFLYLTISQYFLVRYFPHPARSELMTGENEDFFFKPSKFLDGNFDVFQNHNVSQETQKLVMKHIKSLQRNLTNWNLRSSSVYWKKEMQHNRYKITRKKHHSRIRPSGQNLCSVKLRTIEKEDNILAWMNFSSFLPDQTLEHIVTERFRKRESCSIVSSSGALMGSQLGSEIDLNDLVIRFNDAPTRDFTRDVGTKISIRIINSLVFKRNESLVNNSLYVDTINLLWDPSEYNVNLSEWSTKPDHNFFPNFIRFREQYPTIPVYIIHPKVLWDLWDQIQASQSKPIMRTPPSSGFIGMFIAMKLCSFVYLYEYVPSLRISENCHYYDNTTGLGCTLGDWHPLAAEKMFALLINIGSDYDVAIKGKVKIRGCN